MKDYSELLHCLREHAKFHSDCDSCIFYDAEARGYETCSEELAKKAADAIESLIKECVGTQNGKE